jgi:hypothetical protein
VNFLKRLLRPKAQTPTDPSDIVADYGNVLEVARPNFGGAIAIEMLPYEKTVIKEALLMVAASQDCTPRLLEALEVGFVSLAKFQAGVEVTSQSEIEESLERLKFSDDLETISADIEKLTSQSEGHAEVIMAEMTALQAEWIMRAPGHA